MQKLIVFIKEFYYSLRYDHFDQEVRYQMAVLVEAPADQKGKQRLKLHQAVVNRAKVHQKMMELTHVR